MALLGTTQNPFLHMLQPYASVMPIVVIRYWSKPFQSLAFNFSC